MTTAPTRSRAGAFRFPDLPAELRNKIYVSVLTRNSTGRGLQPQLLTTCRQVHQEASGLLYSLNQIDVSVYHDAVKWHGLEYRGSGAIHFLLPFKKPSPADKPSFCFLQMADRLSIRLIHHHDPSWSQCAKHPIPHTPQEWNAVYQLRANVKWLVDQIVQTDHRPKSLLIEFQLDGPLHQYAEKAVVIEGWLLAVFEKKMRGIDELKFCNTGDPENAEGVGKLMTGPRVEKYAFSHLVFWKDKWLTGIVR